jgi:hypothetical protein
MRRRAGRAAASGEEVGKFSDNRIKRFRHRQSVERKFR